MLLRRVYIKRAGGEIASQACYAAWKGFTHRAYSIDFFELVDLKKKYLVLDRETLVVGGTNAVHMALEQIGIAIPQPLNLPASLADFAGRKVWQSTLSAIRDAVKSGALTPTFVKPLSDAKTFPGSVISSEKDLQLLQHLDDDLALQASEVLAIASEWRYFIHHENIVGVAHYQGDWSIAPSADIVRQAVAAYTPAPAAYSLDFGVTPAGATLLIEANDAFALGVYGLDAVVYSKMLEDRWLEIVGLV